MNIKRDKRFRKGLALLFLLTGLSLFGACTDREPIRLGYLGPLSGRYADLGLAGRNGALLAVEECNKSGGIHGRTVELLTGDSQGNSSGAITAVRKLSQAGIELLIGPMLSQTAMVIKPEVDRMRLVTLSPTVATEKLDGLDDWFLRIYPSTRQNAEELAAQLVKEEKLRDLSVVIDETNAAYTQTFYRSLARTFSTLGGRLAAPVTFHSGEVVPFYRLAQTIIAQKTGGVLFLAGAMDTAMFLHQLRGKGYDKPAYATEWSGTEDLLSYGGGAVEGLTFYNTFDRESSAPAYLKFVQSYRNRFGREPGFASVHAYDATRMALEALRRDGESPQRRKEALLGLGSFPGLQTKLKLNPTGDVNRPLFKVRIDNGHFHTLR